MAPDELDARLAEVGAFAEPARRALYLFVVGQPDAVGRDQAAAGVGLARHTAKFHLDRLVEVGLLDTEFRRLSGRDGPGAGRPSKLYRRAARQVSVSLPERRYDLAGHILARGVEAAAGSGAPVRTAVNEAAAATGRETGAALPPSGSAGDLSRLTAALAGLGYEPRPGAGDPTVDGGTEVVLTSCPFHSLAAEHTDLVCGMNLHLVRGLAEGVRCTDVHVRLDPAPHRCCVTLGAAALPSLAGQAAGGETVDVSLAAPTQRP